MRRENMEGGGERIRKEEVQQGTITPSSGS